MSDQKNEDPQKAVHKENIFGAWVLILALLLIPILVKYVFFPDK